uniref:Replication associated protein n=1 Tax=Antarctic circular DNA molecule TaxID=2664238 RepID=A0A5Q2EYY2_9ZZZZ|nr:replication associated protein [Antarctic circular DNA molecule]
MSADLPRTMSRNYCFTWNNPTSPIALHEKIGYLIYQEEIGESGTPHYQGYVEFKSKTRITAIKKLGLPWNVCHLEVRRGTQEEAIAYCTKEETRKPDTLPLEFGVKQAAGKTRKYSAMCNALMAGEDVTTDEHFEEYLKHKRNVDEVIRDRKKMKVSDIEVDIALTSWQEDLITIFSSKPNPRTIHWRWESQGNAGKTTFTKYLVKHHQAIMIDTTAKERVIRAYSQEPVVVFDINRAEGKEDQVNYGIMETLKNGMGFNTMYEPCMKIWPSPHVLVFSNFPPKEGKLSVDRLDTVEIPSLLGVIPPPVVDYNPFDFIQP